MCFSKFTYVICSRTYTSHLAFFSRCLCFRSCDPDGEIHPESGRAEEQADEEDHSDKYYVYVEEQGESAADSSNPLVVRIPEELLYRLFCWLCIFFSLWGRGLVRLAQLADDSLCHSDVHDFSAAEPSFEQVSYPGFQFVHHFLA